MQLEEAIQWMQTESARVNFISVHGTRRVRVKCPGHPYIERSTFLEAVEDCKNDLIQRRSQGLYSYQPEYAQNLSKLLEDSDRKWIVEIFNEFDRTIDQEEGSIDQRKFITELAKTVPEIAEVLEEYELNLYDWRVAMIRIILLLVISLTRLETKWNTAQPKDIQFLTYNTWRTNWAG